MLFRNTYGEEFELNDILNLYRKQVANDEPGQEYKLIVGSDSQRHGQRTLYITVIVLHRVGKGGRIFYFKNILPHNNRIDLSVRIMQETEYTVSVLQAIEDTDLLATIGRENISAHVDAGHNGDSRKIVDACVGWITALGYDTIHKPDAWVASHVSDKFTKKIKRKKQK